MRKLRIQSFNIVEVALALAIVGIGIAGIMGLFPVALNASRDSVGDNNAPDAAEYFMSYIETQVALTPSPDWSTSGFIFTSLTQITKPISTAEPATWPATPISGTTDLYDGGSGCYKVEQKTGSIVDYSAVIRIWKRPINDLYLNIPHMTATINHSLGYKYGAQIYLEVSWPAEKPYDSREKRLYYMELFNPFAQN